MGWRGFLLPHVVLAGFTHAVGLAGSWAELEGPGYGDWWLQLWGLDFPPLASFHTYLILQGCPLWPFSSTVAWASLWHAYENRGCWYFKGLDSEAPECHFHHIVLMEENHLRFKRKGNRLCILMEEWSAHGGKGRIAGVSIFRELTTEPSPGQLSHFVSLGKAQMPRIMQTQSFWGHLCCHGEKARFFKEWIYVYYNWITLLYTWNECNIVNLLYSNKIKKKEKTHLRTKSAQRKAEQEVEKKNGEIQLSTEVEQRGCRAKWLNGSVLGVVLPWVLI